MIKFYHLSPQQYCNVLRYAEQEYKDGKIDGNIIYHWNLVKIYLKKHYNLTYYVDVATDGYIEHEDEKALTFFILKYS